MGLLHFFETPHGVIIFIETCICLASWFSHNKLVEKAEPSRRNGGSNNMKFQRGGQKPIQ
jgi:hypothetical protein